MKKKITLKRLIIFYFAIIASIPFLISDYQGWVKQKALNEALREFRETNELALKQFEEIAKKKHPLYIRKGYTYIKQKKWSKAIEQFTSVIKRYPKCVEAYEGCGEAYKERGHQTQNSADFELSIRHYEEAEKIKWQKNFR